MLSNDKQIATISEYANTVDSCSVSPSRNSSSPCLRSGPCRAHVHWQVRRVQRGHRWGRVRYRGWSCDAHSTRNLLRETETTSTSERSATAHRSVDLAWSFNFCFDHCMLLAQATSSKLWNRSQKPTVGTHERHPETPAIVRQHVAIKQVVYHDAFSRFGAVNVRLSACVP